MSEGQQQKNSRRRLFALLAAAGAAVLALLCAELGVRLLWRTAPENILPTQTPYYMRSGNPEQVMVLAPGISGFNEFTHFRINSRGCRGPEYPPRKQGGLRIAVVGDSFVFGTGLEESRTLPARMEEQLRRAGLGAEVINAGVPGYNIEQSAARAEQVARDYRPDLLVQVLIYNDLENKFYALESGVLPVLKASPHADNPERNALGKVSDAMLPVRNNIKATPSVAIRYFIANHWRTWLCAALNLRKAGNPWPPSRRRFTFPRTPSLQSERLIWKRVDDAFAVLRGAADEVHATPVALLYMDYYIEGAPALRIRAAAARSGVAFFDLSPEWGDMRRFQRRYSLGWDAHPNARANEAAAKRLIECLAAADLLEGAPAGMKSAGNEFLRRGRENEARHRGLAGRREKDWEKYSETFTDTLAPRAGAPEDQWLHGWWPEDSFRWDDGGGRWMSRAGGFLLRARDRDADIVSVRGYRASEPGSAQPPMSLSVSCGGHTSSESITVEPGAFRWNIALPKDYRPREAIECELFASRAVTPEYLGKDGGDNRLISIAVTSVGLIRRTPSLK